jgi:hypothetical protein
MRMFSAPRWAAPVAIAATVVLGLAVVFQAGEQQQPLRAPEVTVENVAQQLEQAPVVADATAPANRSDVAAETSAPAPADAVVVDLGVPMSTPAMPRQETTVARGAPPPAPAMEGTAAPATAKASSDLAWRRDAQTWLAEIDRLRAAGETARADAEMAEYNREHRAFAGAPDR